MKKFLSTRAGALLLAVVVIIVSVLLNTRVNLSAKVREVTNGFYDGVYVESDGYKHSSISQQLDMRAAAANGICSLASSFDGLDTQVKALRDARTTLLETDTIAGKYKANLALQEAWDILIYAMSDLDMGANTAAFETYKSNFAGAQNVIDQAGYNESVRKFNDKTMEKFPTKFLAAVTGVHGPELFA